MGEDIIREILVSLGRIEERLKSQAEQSEHRHNNLKLVVQGFVPRSELDERFKAVEGRVGKVEGNQNKAFWAIASAWLSGIGVVLTLLLKKM